MGVGSGAPDKLELPDPGVEPPLPIAVTPVQPLRRPLVPPGPDQALHVRLHQELQHGLSNRPQEAAVAGLLQELGQGQSVLGHRISSSVRVRASQLHLRPPIR